MSPIDRIKKEYYATLVIDLFVLIVSFMAMVWSLIDDFEVPNYDIEAMIRVFFLPFTCFFVIVVFTNFLVKLLKDFKQIRSNNYKQLVGRVVGFAKNQTETGDQINNFPEIYIKETKKTIELHVSDHVNLNQEYTFLYLEHTRIGAVKCEEVDDKL